AAWNNTPVLRVDLEGHGREDLFEDVDLSRTVGWFTTLFPVMLDIRRISHPGEALQAVKEQLRQVPNHGIGYGLLRYLNEDPQVGQQLREQLKTEISFNYMS